MLISIECQDAVGTLDRIKVVAFQGDLGEATWEDNALAIQDEGSKIRFEPRLDVLRQRPRGSAREFLRFESPEGSLSRYRERNLADKLRNLITTLLLNDGLKPDHFTITVQISRPTVQQKETS